MESGNVVLQWRGAAVPPRLLGDCIVDMLGSRSSRSGVYHANWYRFRLCVCQCVGVCMHLHVVSIGWMGCAGSSLLVVNESTMGHVCDAQMVIN